MSSRRNFLLQGSGLAVSLLWGQKVFAQDNSLLFGNPQPFSFDILAQRAQEKSKTTYIEKFNSNYAVLDKLGYQELGEIRFKTENALFAVKNSYPVTFFHMGSFFKKPVKMVLLEENGGNLFGREIVYNPQYFNIPDNSYAKQLDNSDIGFAGFRIQEKNDGTDRWKTNDWVAFLGSAYFRAIGSLSQYGLSARGLAIDSGIPNKKEDFPVFTEFYFAPQTSDDIVVYALMEGKSVVGAYKFILKRTEAVEMEVSAKIFVREETTRFGIAPLTSMFWYSEATKTVKDWRPEIHDSDGLSILTNEGKWIWRQLQNPNKISVSAFKEDNVRGFGLIQRDRNFENYLDGVHYDKRPNLWVEPISSFGAGAVELIELPTQDETNDNIVVCWVPEAPVMPGQILDINYRLYWGDLEKITDAPLARAISTRIGFGGQPGQVRKEHLKKFVVEFQGHNLPLVDQPDIRLSSDGGVFSTVLWEKVPTAKKDRIRIQFDFELQQDVADIQLYLIHKNTSILMTETWVYQVHR